MKKRRSDTGRFAASATVQVWAVLLVSGALAGCATTYGSMLIDGLLDPPAVIQHRGSAGETNDIYWIDTAPDPRSAIFFVQGSGCHSLGFFMRSYFAGLSGTYRIYATQKPGVGRTSAGLVCSDAYLDWNSFPQIVAHNREALRVVMARHGGSLAAVIGVSEGGTVAAQLAAENPQIRRLVVIGSGGLPFRKAAQLLAAKRGEPPSSIDAAFARIAADPDNARATVYGMTHRYWSTLLDVDPTPTFLKLKQPTLLVMGELDQSVPIESAVHLRNEMAAAKRSNFALEVVPGASHLLVRDGVDQKPAVMRRIGVWLDGTPSFHQGEQAP